MGDAPISSNLRLMNKESTHTSSKEILRRVPVERQCSMQHGQSVIAVFSTGFIIYLLAFLLPITSIAQEEFIAPPAQHITNIPITMLTGGIIILRATLDDFQDSLNLVLDTGSGGISLDSLTCEKHNLKKEHSNRIVRGIAGMRTVDFTYNHTLHFHGLTVNNLDFHLNDYEILTSAYGVKIDGIIGFSFLRRYIVALDYDKLTMEVFTPGTYKYPRGGYVLRPQFSTLPMQTATLKDENIVNSKFYFDIGAGLCFLLNEDLVKDSALLRKKRKQYKTQAEGLGGKKEMMMSVVREVRVGPYKFRNVPVHIFNDEFNVTAYPVLGGLMGNDILRRFNIILNYPEQQIYIKPNKHYTDSFDYSYTGLGIYLINGAITVTDIVENSPAQAAGLQIGDVVIGIETNFSNNIQAYKALIQNPKTKVKILITRNGQPLILFLKVKSIL